MPMRPKHPSVRALTLAWLLLMALTVASMASGRAASGDPAPLGLGLVAILLGVTVVKAMRVLNVYLNLRAATPGWRHAFGAILIVICLFILAAYAVAPHLG